MRRLAGLFSALFIGAVVAMIAVVILTRPPAPVLPRTPLTGQVDHILVEKSARTLTVFRGGEALRTYPIALGNEPVGDKDRQGDGRTPEGVFRIDRRNGGSAYHLSLGLDYPQPEDVARARAGGYAPGGDIFIHGQPNALPEGITLGYDWTAGCIAVSNADIEELWQVVPVGTPVEVRP